MLLLLLLVALGAGGARTIYQNGSQRIAMRPLDLDPVHPGQRRLGELIFLAAWELDSDNGDFGGISALSALSGGRFISVSDAGTLIGFGVAKRTRAPRSFIMPLPESDAPENSYRDRDSEGITYDPASGQFWVSYEAKHAIRRFSGSFDQANGVVRPKEMQGWPRNKGAETIVRLPDGRFMVIAESLEEGVHQGLLFSGDPVETETAVASFSFRPPAGYRVTDGSMLPDGRLLLLNRRVGLPGGFKAKLAVVEIQDLEKGARMNARVIATLGTPLLVDNMEGVAVTREQDNIIIWLISDNNFNFWQRTLLMKFQLSERPGKKKPESDSRSRS